MSLLLDKEDIARIERTIGYNLYPAGKTSLYRGNGMLHEIRKSRLKRVSGQEPHYWLSASRDPDVDIYIAVFPEFGQIFSMDMHELRTNYQPYWDRRKQRYHFTIVPDDEWGRAILYGKKTPEGRGFEISDHIKDLVLVDW